MQPTLTPAYGRDYKNAKEVLADFEKGKDFILNSFQGSGICNKEDLINQGVKLATIRYSRMTKLTVVKL